MLEVNKTIKETKTQTTILSTKTTIRAIIYEDYKSRYKIKVHETTARKETMDKTHKKSGC